MAFTTSIPETTFAKTVKPPFWLSRLPLLSPRLKKNSFVAEFGSPPDLRVRDGAQSGSSARESLGVELVVHRRLP